MYIHVHCLPVRWRGYISGKRKTTLQIRLWCGQHSHEMTYEIQKTEHQESTGDVDPARHTGRNEENGGNRSL